MPMIKKSLQLTTILISISIFNLSFNTIALIEFSLECIFVSILYFTSPMLLAYLIDLTRILRSIKILNMSNFGLRRAHE